MDQSWPVRVVVAENDIRKVTFHDRPNNLEELISELKKRLSLQTLAEIVAQVETKTHDVKAKRTAVLRCLPVFLGDDGSDFFKVCFDSDATLDFTQVPVGVVTVIPEDSQQLGPNALHLEPSSIGIILEGRFLTECINLEDLQRRDGEIVKLLKKGAAGLDVQTSSHLRSTVSRLPPDSLITADTLFISGTQNEPVKAARKPNAFSSGTMKS
ncbi:hypothetical protein D9C73_010168 [Collichthys lucidus]|uniref:Uncharacterized protein n=1 Tax=Collichthys lucidus TaxID=240159 RepID=A0A4U5UMT2_COLLU|nr:hypothetical protein D9C73_010168 [Collichthys lucidus]